MERPSLKIHVKDPSRRHLICPPRPGPLHRPPTTRLLFPVQRRIPVLTNHLPLLHLGFTPHRTCHHLDLRAAIAPLFPVLIRIGYPLHPQVMMMNCHPSDNLYSHQFRAFYYYSSFVIYRSHLHRDIGRNYYLFRLSLLSLLLSTALRLFIDASIQSCPSVKFPLTCSCSALCFSAWHLYHLLA